MPPKKKNSQTIRNEFSKILTKSKRRSIKLESDRGKEWYISVFKNVLRFKNIQPSSRFTDKGTSIADQVINTIPNLFKKPLFLKSNAYWVSELSSGINKYNNSYHNSIKTKPILNFK